MQRDWIEQCFTSPPTQYRLYGRRLLQVKRPNQQYQSTEGTNSTNQTYNKQTWTQNTANPLVYNNMGWLGDGSHRGQGCQAWTAVGLPLRYPRRLTEFTVVKLQQAKIGRATAIFSCWDEWHPPGSLWWWYPQPMSWLVQNSQPSQPIAWLILIKLNVTTVKYNTKT